MPFWDKHKDTGELSEIIESVPRWYIRYGLSIIFLLLIGSIIFINSLRLPQVFTFSVTLEESVHDFRFELSKAASDFNLLVRNGDTVIVNSPLASFKESSMEDIVIRSPIEGVFKIIEDSMTHQMSFTVISKEPSIGANGVIDEIDIKKVNIGAKVKITLDAYPGKIHGFLEGNILKITKSPIQGKYLIEISLNNQLRTSNNKELIVTDNAKGIAETNYKDKTVLQSLFGEVWKF